MIVIYQYSFNQIDSYSASFYRTRFLADQPNSRFAQSRCESKNPHSPDCPRKKSSVIIRVCALFARGSGGGLSDSISGLEVTTRCSRRSLWEYSRPSAAPGEDRAPISSTPPPSLRTPPRNRRDGSCSSKKVEGVAGSPRRPCYRTARVGVRTGTREHCNTRQVLSPCRAGRSPSSCSASDSGVRTGSSRQPGPSDYQLKLQGIKMRSHRTIFTFFARIEAIDSFQTSPESRLRHRGSTGFMFLRESDYFRVAFVFSLPSLKSLEFKSIYSITNYPSFSSLLGLRGAFSVKEGLISIELFLGGCCGSSYLISSSILTGM